MELEIGINVILFTTAVMIIKLLILTYLIGTHNQLLHH